MTAITRLPPRPLRPEDLSTLDSDDRIKIVPYGGIPGEGDLDVYAVKLAIEGSAHALCFDDGQGQWRQIATVETNDLAAADEELDAALDTWIREHYGSRFELFKSP